MKRIVSSGLLLSSNHRQICAFLVKRPLSSEQKREELVCVFDKNLPRNHVVASFTWLATTFLFYKQVIAATPFRNPRRFALLQRKIARFPRVPWSRSVRLFACKRAHDGSLSLPTFCGFPRVRIQLSKTQIHLFRTRSAMKKALFVYQTKALFSTKSVLTDG